MSMRAMIFSLVALLIVSAVGSALGLAWWQSRQLSDQLINDAFERTSATRQSFQQQRYAQLELIALTFANDPNLSSYIAEAVGGGLPGQSEVDTASIADLVNQWRLDIGLDLALVLDVDGALLARNERPGNGEDYAEDPMVAEIIDQLEPTVGFWQPQAGQLFQTALVPLEQDFNLLGFLMVGFEVGSGMVEEVKRTAGAELVWLQDGQAIASTLPDQDTAELLAAFAGAGIQIDAQEIQPVSLQGQSWIAEVSPLDAEAEAGPSSVSLMSKQRLLAGYRSLQRNMLLAGLATIGVGLLLSLLLARRVAGPIHNFAEVATAAAQGDYDREFKSDGDNEVGRLGRAFRVLISELREKRDMEEYVADLARHLPEPRANNSARTTRSTPTIDPTRSKSFLLGWQDRNLLSLVESGQSVNTTLDQMQSDLGILSWDVSQEKGDLLAVLGDRVVFSFEHPDHALSAAARLSRRNIQVSMAMVYGRVDRGGLRTSAGPQPLLLGKPVAQLERLLEETPAGAITFSPTVSQVSKGLLQAFGVTLGAVSGTASGKKFAGIPLGKLEAAQVVDPDATQASGLGETGPQVTSQFKGIVPGELFAGRYDVVSPLGQGGMGQVYKALDLKLDDFVALKVMSPDLVGRAGFLEQLKDEIRLARKVTHPNVLRTYDFGEHDGEAYISMEYVRGMTLLYLLENRRRLPFSAGLRICRQLCAGLAAAHSQDVIHRDIKPENIMIEANGNAKLMDFGIASPLQELRSGSQHFVGTVVYAAPEQMQGLAVDARADVYACGVLMYELFTGASPFATDEIDANVVAKATEAFSKPSEHWPEIPPQLEQIVARAMAADPNKRYANAAELGQALAEVHL